MNLTLYSLFASYLSTSPMLMFPSSNDRTTTLKFDHLYTRKFFTTFLYTNKVTASIYQSSFINYMNTPLVFRSTDCSINGDLGNIYQQNYENCQFLVIDKSSATTVIIDSCNFDKCEASDNNNNGGAILFKDQGSLTVHGSFFKDSFAKNGGAIFAVKTEGTSGSEISHTDATLFHSHYCCYSSCSAEGYGSAALIAAVNIQLNYSSTLNCPNKDRDTDGNYAATGAQFDLKASETDSPFIASTSINSTTGRSKYCASLEYRNANSGFFKYQTIVDQEGGFITSFTDLKNDVEISNCNIINVTIHGGLDKDAPPGVVHIRHKGVTISNFFFYGVNFTEDVPADTARLITIQNGEQGQYTVLLKDSVVEIEQNYITGGNFNTESITVVDPSSNAEVRTLAITQLFLGDCQGEVKKSPPPIDYVEPDPTSEITSEPTSEITSEPTSEITSEPTSEITSEPTSEITSEPAIEPTSIKETDPLIPEDPPRQRSGGSNKTPIIAGSVAAVAAVAVIAALVAFFLIRRRRLNFNNDADLNETLDSSVTTDNELRKMMSKDDPFDEEFKNQVQTDL